MADDKGNAKKHTDNNRNLTIYLEICLFLVAVLLVVMVFLVYDTLRNKRNFELRYSVEKSIAKFLLIKESDESAIDSFCKDNNYSMVAIYDYDKEYNQAIILRSFPIKVDDDTLPYSDTFEITVNRLGEIEASSIIDFPVQESYLSKNYYIRFENAEYIRGLSFLKLTRDFVVLIAFSIYLFLVWLYKYYLGIRDKFKDKEKLMILGSAQRRLAHEIKNPLSAILMQVTLLEKMHPDQIDEYQIIKSEGKRVLTLTDRIREFMTDTEGKSEEINVIDFLQEEIKLFQPGIIILNVYISATTAFVSFDKIRLRSILTNVIQNAIDSQIDKPKCEVVININSAEHGSKIRIDVIDSGTGIADHDKAKIFNPFYTTKNVGTGIGLSICKKFVTAKGGSIELNNRYDVDGRVAGAICTIILVRSI